MKKLALALLLVMTTGPLAAQELSAADLDRRRKALNDLLHEQWEYTLKSAPEFASILGDRRYNDQVSDVSEKATIADLEMTKKFLARFEKIDTTAFSDQEKLNRNLMVRDLRNAIEGAKFKSWLTPVNQMGGIHLEAAQLPSALPFATVKDYDDYIVRLSKFPKTMDDTITNMRKGMAMRLMPPKFLLEKVVVQAEGLAQPQGEESPFAIPLKDFPETFSEEEKTRLRTAILGAIDRFVLPSYTRFANYVRDQYAPKGRIDVGSWALPNGAERYAYLVRLMTTTNRSPEEIHEIGLAEVARIEGEMLQIAKKLGYSDLKSFNAAVEANPELKAKSRQDMLDLYTKYIDQMYARLPQLFGRLPKAKLEVVPVQEFREKEAASASYETGSPDGSRPGRVFVNTYEATSRKTLSIESTAYHEGAPGHHMQLAIQQELPELPPFRQHGGYTAFIEGWALYSERLGKEVGYYQDPYSDYGRLNDEMLRAIRLVVDTGLHNKKWTREQVVQFFRDHSAVDEVEIQSETDRYIVWPGQALAYKMGQLKILELRDRAQKELGANFDIRGFHDEILGAGALPLQELEDRIVAWIARRKS
ncbi:MAG TPA: DUF885 family protein [Thermoanaerobaculia bacterium]|jgi:uncharacterized protein (DUF885 family)|nr:DUF885 family protein [Thermoanaerobaculia bacterium]